MLPDLPPIFVTRMRTLLGDEAGAFFASFAEPSRLGLRVNTLKLAPDDFLARATFPLQPLPWLPEGFLLSPDDQTRPGLHPDHAAGLYYLQDPSAMLAAILLDPQPGERVLDLCAAPGGKSTHIAARLAGQGLLVANEIIRSRTDALIENLERFGVSNLLVTSAAPERLAAAWPGLFDRVLVDAPCSGEGMFRKAPAARREWSERAVQGCAVRQDGILAAAARLLRPGGRLVYATCTFAPEEDEGAIARFLRGRPDFDLLSPPDLPGLSPGRPDWLDPMLADNLPLGRCVRVWPHRSLGEGHFFAILQRSEERMKDDGRWVMGESKRAEVGGVVDARNLRAGWEAVLHRPCPEEGWIQFGEWAHWLPPLPDGWQDVQPVRAGLRVGRLTKGRFEPAATWALALSADDAHDVLDLPAHSPHLAAYRRGETLIDSGPDGWVLIAVDGFGLGWGKRVQGVIKNHFPRHWRI